MAATSGGFADREPDIWEITAPLYAANYLVNCLVYFHSPLLIPRALGVPAPSSGRWSVDSAMLAPRDSLPARHAELRQTAKLSPAHCLSYHCTRAHPLTSHTRYYLS